LTGLITVISQIINIVCVRRGSAQSVPGHWTVLQWSLIKMTVPPRHAVCEWLGRDWLRETKTHWQDLKSCRQAKETIDGLNHQRTKEILRLPRKMLRLTVGVYTDHNCLNRHLSLLGLINSPE